MLKDGICNISFFPPSPASFMEICKILSDVLCNLAFADRAEGVEWQELRNKKRWRGRIEGEQRG